MKKTSTEYDDGLEWLREIRRKIWDECDHDVDKLMAHYRRIDAEERERRRQKDLVLRGAKK